MQAKPQNGQGYGVTEGALLKPAMDTAQKAAKAGKLKSLKVKMKFGKDKK